MAQRERKPKPKRKRRSGAIVFLNVLLTLVFLVVVAVGAVSYLGFKSFYAPGSNTDETAFLVAKGSGLNTIATRLQDEGLIDSPLLFRAGVWVLKRDAHVLPGQYTLPARASMADILQVITETKPTEFFVDVIPGETSWQVAQFLNDPTQTLTGDPVPPPPEGSLLAVRHDFFPGDTRQSLLDAMQKKMDDELATIWAGHDPSIDDVIKSPAQLVTMASLVEKETGLDSERPQVAAVFINRLRKHMKLQTDPSVMYGLTLGKTKLDGGLTIADLKSKTPYNTYQIDGLPPGPIANPGAEALQAVAHPDSNNDLYFVAVDADPSHGHRFAPTYAEHKKNVALYRKAVREQASADQAAADAAKEALEQEQATQAGDTGG